MKNLITFLCVLLYFTNLFAQNPIEAPSPISLNYNEFVNSAYNANNGTANINIPIATIAEGSITHSVSIYANTDAPKAHDQASIVGLGWHMNAGGMISRQIRGIPDEDQNGYYGNSGGPIDVNSAADENSDSAPDQYYFNIGSLSGSFTIDDTGDFVTIPKSRIKIETDETNPLSTFLITDDLGTKYYFAYDETTYAVETVDYGSEGQIKTGWFLTKIESQDGIMEFEYEDMLAETRYISEQYSLKYVDVANNDAISGSGLIKTGNISNSSNVLSEQPIYSKNITKIKSTTKEIEFLYDIYRSDTKSYNTITGQQIDIYTKKLIQIKIKEGDLTDCKKYDFNYSHFYGTSNLPGWTYPEYTKYRLKLEEVIPSSCAGSSQPPIKIEYYGSMNGNGLQYFPNQYTTNIDHWGYYNDGGNGESLIPTIAVDVQYGSTLPQYFNLVGGGGANKEPSLTATLNGAIKSITYPTGGSIHYEYELNEYEETVTTSDLMYVEVCGSACCQEVVSGFTNPISFSQDEMNEAEIKLNISPHNCSVNASLVLEIYEGNANSSDSPIGNVSINYNSDWNTNTSSTFNLSTNPYIEPNEVYKFKLKGENILFGSFAKIVTDATTINKLAGGLRLKKTILKDGISSVNEIISEYKYENSTTGKSSGYNFLPANSYYDIPDEFLPQVMFHYSANFASNNFYSTHIGYEETKTINNQKGWTISKFKPGPNYIETSFPIVPVAYDSDLNFLEETSIYNQNEDLLSKSSYKKNIDFENNVHQYLLKEIRKAPYYDYGDNELVNDHVYANSYWIKTGISRLKSQTEIVDGVSSKTEYTYFTGQDAEKCFKPKSSKIIDKNEDEYENKYKYTFDYDIDQVSPANNDGDPSWCIHGELFQTNIVGLLWQTESTYNGILVNGSRNKIKIFDNTTGERVICGQSSNTSLKLWKNYRIENTWIDGSFVNDGWKPISEIIRYDRVAGENKLRSPEKIVRDGWQNYTENVYDNLNRLTDSKQVTTIFGAQPTIGSTYNYLGTSNLLSSIIAPDATSTTFGYDEYLRKDEETDCHGVVTSVTYDINGITNNIPNNSITTITDFKLSINYDSNGPSAVEELESKNYLDGLGRSVQKLGINQSQDEMMDMVSIMEYDNYGNSTKSFFQFESSQNNNGQYTSPSSSLLYGTQVFDESPLNRIESSDPPGDLGIVTQEYGTNDELVDEVLYYNSSATYYGTGELRKTSSIDQNGHRSIVFTDILGRKILSRRESGNIPIERSDTYYLYDAKQKLTKVIPPGANPLTTPDLIYEYSYYGNGKMRSKKIPGADEVLYLYNDRELLGATQDGNMRAENPNKWMAYEYDEHGRMVKTGFILETLDNEDFVNPTIFSEVLSTHTFDSKHRPERDEHKILGTSDFLYTKYNYNSCSDLTGTRSNHQLHLNPLYNSHIEDYFYDGMGNLVEQNTIVYLQGSILRYDERYHYDHAGRIIETFHRYDNGAWKPISAMAYDDQERIKTKYLGNTNGNWLQKIDYTYTDFGQLKSINGDKLVNNDINVGYHSTNLVFANTNSLDERDLFQQELFYNDQLPSNLIWSGTAANTENGNIKATIWQNRGKRQAAYTYDYSYKNELETARFYKENSSNIIVGPGDHSVFFDYSDNGTLINITRNDQLSFTQISNNLISNSVLIDNMTINNVTYNQHYDNNGNMKNYKNYGLDYNFLDLPTHKYEQLCVEVIDPTSNPPIYNEECFPSKTLSSYQYLANGSKLQNWTFNTTFGENTNFIGAFEKFTSFGTEKLRVMFVGGYLSIDQTTNSVIEEVYTISDHLGNVRVSYSDTDQNGEIDVASEVKGINDFYPYGKRINQGIGNNELQYGYNGIENDHLVSDFDLSLATYRSLNSEIGLWLQVDPKAESAYSHSPYNSMFNNPISNVDPNGDFPFLAMGIGAAIGAYSGHQLGKANGASGWGMFGYMLGGAAMGGLSGGVGSAISTSGIAFANTGAIMGASFTNSLGMKVLSGGQSDLSISFGVGSFNFDSEEFGYLGKSGNSKSENWGFALGSLANLADINQLINSTNATLYTQERYENGDPDKLISHSGILDDDTGDILMSFGPNSDAKLKGHIGFALEPKRSTSNYPVPTSLSKSAGGLTVNKYTFKLTRGLGRVLPYQGCTINCVNMSSLSLWLNGIPNLPLHPLLHHYSVQAYNLGARADLFSHHLQN